MFMISSSENGSLNSRKVTCVRTRAVRRPGSSIHVGARMRQRRTLLGMSQTKLGDAVGLTFQQVQKYERGSNRMGSSRLYEFGKVLDVPISHFFEEMPANVLAGKSAPERRGRGGGGTGAPLEQEMSPLTKRETLELVRAYYKIRHDRVRKHIFEMVKTVGAAGPVNAKTRCKKR